MTNTFRNTSHPDEGVLVGIDSRGRTNLSRVSTSARSTTFLGTREPDGTLILSPVTDANT